MKLYRGISFLIFNLCVSFVYGIDKPSKPVQYYIDNKIPFYLTGNSTQPQMGNELPFYFLSLRHDGYADSKSVSYSSVSILVNNEFRMAPLNYISSLYPIKLLSENIVICTISPKAGTSYYNYYQFDERELVYVNFDNAVSTNEISETPVELGIDNFKKYVGLLSSEYNLNGGLTLRCVLNELLKKYTWIDEFQKEDFYQKAVQKYNPIFLKGIGSNYNNASNQGDNSYYIDYEAKFGQYNFEKYSFPITLKRLTEYSSNLANFPFDIVIKASDQTIQISKSDLVQSNYDFSTKRWLNILANNETRYNYYSNSISFDFFINRDGARDLSANFNDDRTAVIRLYLEPVKKYSNLYGIGCDKLSDVKISFNVRDIKISQNTAKEPTSNFALRKAEEKKIKDQISGLFSNGKTGASNDINNSYDSSVDNQSDNQSDGLKGRTWIQRPMVFDNSQKTGKVVVVVKVNKEGNVVYAKYQPKGSTTTDPYLIQLAEKGALKAKFSKDPYAEEEQQGTIYFIFSGQELVGNSPQEQNSGSNNTPNANQPEIFDRADVMPNYPGGIPELMKFLQKNIRYPSLARENGLEGKVIVKFYVGTDGSVKDPIVLKDGVGGDADLEAIRVVKAMPKWTPGSQNGKPVNVYYTLPVTFKLQ